AHPGTAVGNPPFVDGKIGQAVRLNGTGDYVELTGYQGILGANPITVAAWIKTTNTETGAIIGWGANVAAQRFGFRVNEGRLRLEHQGGNVQGDGIVNDGAWHHVAVTVQADATISYPEVILWLDGHDDTRETTDPDPFDLTAGPDARIGSRPSVDDRFFMGEIDELYIYDRTLSAAEIAWLAGRTQPFDVPFVPEDFSAPTVARQ
ncbi:MAG: LamG domain-containing protein, partial [Planctomycetota bacterium]